MKNSGKSFVVGAAVIASGGIIAKILGAVYRIPLTNLLGSTGMGIYHMVFPLYTLLLAVSGAGIPAAISRLIAERTRMQDEAGAQVIFKSSYIFLSVLGLILALLLFVFADNAAAMQDTPQAAGAYRMIAPAVFLVTQISVLRGYFQGRMNMVPTALSQIIEQAVKIAFSLTVAVSFLPDVISAVTYSILAVSVSEAVSLLFLLAVFFIDRRKRRIAAKIAPASEVSFENGKKAVPGVKSLTFFSAILLILAVSIPVTISSIILPLSQIIDSVLVVKLIGGYYSGNILSLYGLYSGPVSSLTGLPVTVAAGIAVAIVPYIAASRVKGGGEAVTEKIELAVKLTFLISLPAAIGMFLFAGNIMTILYPRLAAAELFTAVRLLKISAVSIVFLSLMQTAVSILVALKRGGVTTINLISAIAIKLLLNVILLRVPRLNIFGAAISAAVCYFVAALLNMLYIIRFTGRYIALRKTFFKPLFCSALALGFAYLTYSLLSLLLRQNISFLIAVALCLPVFLLAVFKTNVFTKSELKVVPILSRLKI